MSEKDQRRRVVKALRELHAIAVENPARVGTPDVNYAGGWIELKWLRQWPAKPETPVRLPHFTLVQKAWITNRAQAGGNIWVMLQCKKEWMIWDGPTACKILGQTPKQQLLEQSRHYWPNGLNAKELQTLLMQSIF